MDNYPCNPLPLLPPGTSIVEPGPLRAKRGYVVMGGEFPVAFDDWAVASLEPEVEAAGFDGAIAIIIDLLEHKGLTVRHTSRCGMGTALIQFVSSCDRDTAVEASPFFIGDAVLRFVKQDRCINFRETVFTHDVWLMLVNYPLECWEVDTVVRTMTPDGRFLIWSKDNSNKARIVVKIRAYNVDTLPVSIVVLRNSSDNGAGESWTCPTYILARNMLGVLGGDEDPILPDGENPHPMPNVFHGFWHDLHAGNNDFNPNPAPIVVDVENGNIEVIQLPDTPDQNMERDNNANVVHDINLNEPPSVDGVTDIPVENQAVEVVTADNELPNQIVNEQAQAGGENLMDPILALQGLVSAVIANSQVVLPKLDTAQIVGASCKIVGVQGDRGSVRKCFLQIQTVDRIQKKSSTREFTEIVEESAVIPQAVNPDEATLQVGQKKRRKKARVPTTVAQVRRSKRIAGETLGYKDVASAKAVEADHTDDEAFVDLLPKFDATVVDSNAAPPPHLPLKTVHAIATGHCKMHPKEVSEEAMPYDSSNDSK
ncbi:hypothetical protein ACQ4PT_071868 [Festuca glaucescens]